MGKKYVVALYVHTDREADDMFEMLEAKKVRYLIHQSFPVEAQVVDNMFPAYKRKKVD